MKRYFLFLALTGLLVLSSCAKKESSEEPKTAAESPAAAQPAAEAPAAAETPATAEPAGGPHAIVSLKDGSKVPGTIVASSQADMVVAGDDGIERKIPLSKVQSIVYGEAKSEAPRRRASGESPSKPQPPAGQAAQTPRASVPVQAAQTPASAPVQAVQAPPSAPPQPEVVTRTYEVPEGTEFSVRATETIDSATAREGQTYGVQVTRDIKDTEGRVVIPRGAEGRVVIKSASQGGAIRGASDLVLDLQSVAVNGRQYRVETADVSQKGKSGVGVNKRTAAYTGGGAALGAIIGAIAGGGKGAAIGAGAGAGAGVLTQVLTKGKSIKVPVESVLTFRLDKPLRMTVEQ